MELQEKINDIIEAFNLNFKITTISVSENYVAKTDTRKKEIKYSPELLKKIQKHLNISEEKTDLFFKYILVHEIGHIFDNMKDKDYENILQMEIDAWEIGESLIDWTEDEDKELFQKIKNYCLDSYTKAYC